MGDEVKVLARRYFGEVLSDGRFEVLDEIASPDMVGNDGVATPVKGRDAVRAYLLALRTAFPDLTVQVTHQLSENNFVATRWTATGSHKGDFRGIPPTGRPINISGIHILRVESGRIVEGWANWDGVSLLRQLGVLPPAK